MRRWPSLASEKASGGWRVPVPTETQWHCGLLGLDDACFMTGEITHANSGLYMA
jgi:hypothetical protein